MLFASRAIGISLNTLYKAAAGVDVSEETRKKIEAVFQEKLEDLQRPLDDPSGANAAQRS
jgi:hypothetical protein